MMGIWDLDGFFFFLFLVPIYWQGVIHFPIMICAFLVCLILR